MTDFYKTKLTVEIMVETQFGPADAINVVDIALRFPAVKSVNLVDLKTDYPLPSSKKEVNHKAMTNIPVKIR